MAAPQREREGEGVQGKEKGGVAERKARVKEAYSQHLRLKAQGHLSLARHAQIPFISVKLNRAGSVSAAAAVCIRVCVCVCVRALELSALFQYLC